VNVLAMFIGGILPYVAVFVFLGGMIYRFYVWFKTPQPGKMTLFPAPSSTAGSIISEALLFPSLFRSDKVLWIFSWVFHVTLAVVFLGHIRVFTGLIDSILMAMGISGEGINWMSGTFGGAAGIVLLATGISLLIRRLLLKRVREISGVPDFFALLIILAIIITGDLMRFSGTHFDLEQTRVWAQSLLTFSPEVPKSAAFQVHVLLSLLLIMFMPFSKILHFGGFFFTNALIKRR